MIVTTKALAAACAVDLLASPLIAQEMVEEPSTHKQFAKSIVVEHDGTSYELTISGVAARKKFVFKVYGIAHYMENTSFSDEGAALEAALGDAGGAKRIVMDFARDVDAEKIQGAYREGFEKNSSEEEWKEIAPKIGEFLAYYGQDVKENEQYVLTWLPGGTLIAIVGGEEMTPIESEALARVLWRIWLGEDSIVDRDKLVKLAIGG